MYEKKIVFNIGKKTHTHTQVPIAIRHASEIILHATINIMNRLVMHVIQNLIM